MMPDDALSYPDLLDLHEAEIDAALAEDAIVPHREGSPAMKRALAEVAACGRASRYATLQTGGWVAAPALYGRVHRWVMKCLATGG